MKIKKIIFTVLTVSLVTALAIGCFSPLESAAPDSVEEDTSAPSGMALIRLNLTNSNARTVIPTTTGYTAIGDFDHFRLSIKDTSNNTQTLPGALQGNIALVTTITGTAIPLAPGKTYIFEITAYDDSPTAVKKAAGAKSLAVDTSAGQTLTIALREIVDGAGNGLFTVDKALFSGYGTASLSMEYLGPGGSGSTITDYDIKTNSLNSTTVDVGGGVMVSGVIKSGYYLMTIALTQTGRQFASVVDVVHIYEGFTSTFDGTTTGQAKLPTLRVNVYTINYNYTGNINNPPSGVAGTDYLVSESVTHGGNITHKDIGSSTTDYAFGGWFTSSNSGVTLGVEIKDVAATTPTKIINGDTLYAKWEPTAVDVNFSDVTFDGYTAPIVPTFTGAANYSAGSNGAPGSINISITVENDTDYSAFKWWVDGTLQVGATGKTLTISGDVDSATNWYQKGTHTITIQVTDANTNIPYTGEVTITCN